MSEERIFNPTCGLFEDRRFSGKRARRAGIQALASFRKRDEAERSGSELLERRRSFPSAYAFLSRQDAAACGSADMHEALVDAQIQGNSKRSQKQTGQADDGSPAVTPEIRRLALSFRILVRGDHARHSLAVFWNIGMIPLQHDSPVDRHEFLLGYYECLPARDDVAERPCRRLEKIQEHAVSLVSKAPESAQGCHSDHFGSAYKTYDRHAENDPWLVIRKTTAKSFEGMQIARCP